MAAAIPTVGCMTMWLPSTRSTPDVKCATKRISLIGQTSFFLSLLTRSMRRQSTRSKPLRSMTRYPPHLAEGLKLIEKLAKKPRLNGVEVTKEEFQEFANELGAYQRLYRKMKRIFDSAPTTSAAAMHHMILKDWWLLQNGEPPMLVPDYISRECVEAYATGMFVDDIVEERSDLFKANRALESVSLLPTDYTTLDKDALVTLAKDMGIPYVQKRWRRETIQNKIASHLETVEEAERRKRENEELKSLMKGTKPIPLYLSESSRSDQNTSGSKGKEDESF